MLIGTSTKIVDGYPKNVTKNFSVADLTDFVRVNVSLDDVLAVSNVSTRDAKIGSLYLYDTPLLDYGNISLNQNNFVFSTVASGEVFKVRRGFFRLLANTNIWGNFTFSLLTNSRSWSLPDKDGTFAMLSDIPVISGFVPTSRTLTINGVTYDLSADRSWTISATGGAWGSITGNILDQTDLITYLEENYYPLNSNPAGYLTQQEVEEYPDLASFPVTGIIGVIYIALDTGLFYTWNGSAYILSAAPDTGITGGGIVNRLPKFTPDGVTIGSSNFSDNGVEGRYSLSTTNFISFYPSGNIWLRLQRATTNRMDFILGNSGIGQPAEITTSNAVGLEFKATGTSGYISLKAGTSSLEGIRVLSTGKLQFTQAPDAGVTTDDLLVRDASGNVKIVPYPTIPSLSGYVPYTGATANVDLGEYELKAGQLTLDVSPTGTAAVGTTRWNDTIGSSETTLKGGSVILKNGVDLVARVVNKVTPNTTLTKAAYQAVRVSGAQGQRLAIAYAQANNDNNSADTIGLVCETIPTNQEGFILTVGQLEGIDTTGSLQGETWNDGDVIYLSPTVAGSLTNVKPTAPGHIVVIGYVEYAHAIHGKLYVKIMNGWELDELHNVKITSPQSNDVLMYNSTDSLWENENPFDYFDAKSVAYQKHINMPIFGNAGINNVEGVSITVGNPLARAFDNTNLVTRTQRLGLVVSTTGNAAQIRQITTYFNRQVGFDIITGFNMAENANDVVRAFTGICANTGTFGNTEPNTLLNVVGFCRLSTSNNIHLVYNDNTGIGTTVDLGVNFPGNTISTDKYLVYIKTVPTGIYVKIERVGTAFSYENTLTTDIPSLTTALNFGMYVVDVSGPSTATGIDWHGTYIRILS